MEPEMTVPRSNVPFDLRFSRRDLLRVAGVGAGAAALAPLFAACAKEAAPQAFQGDLAGVVNFANWPLYIDHGTEDGRPTIPSLREFERRTGTQVNYRPVVTDAEVFFQQIQPWLAAGEPTGWDVMVITNGQTLTKLIELGYLLELPADQRPNFDANAGVTVKNPPYDPDNRFTMAWQSGITGIAYNPLLTGRNLTSLQDLFSTEFKGKVGMFGDPVDLPNLTLLANGVNPEDSTPDDWKAAVELLRTQRTQGIVNASYKQDYVSALKNGDVALSMAWSGDIFQSNAKATVSGGTKLEFVVPEEGGVIWTDLMCVPRGAQHTNDAIALMDFVYDPEIAAQIANSVNYITPVPGAHDVLMAQAASVSGATRDSLLATANSPLVFPSEEDQAKLHSYRVLATDEEIAEWNSIFGEFYS